MKNNDNIQFLLIDLFCGAGGTTTGAEMSEVCKVIAAVNHDPLAIESHHANHKEILHLTEDILVADTGLIVAHIAKWQARYPQARVILWASLECTNFSNAKGGLPRDADSRALAQGMFRYLDAINPDYFLIENVREFMAWGDLDENGKPVSKLEGREYVRWVKKVQSCGYQHDWRLLCAADYGGVTIRERYFGAFYKPGQRFAWPQRTHAKKAATGNLFQDEMKPWRAVAEVLDFSDLGRSIFDRKRPLVEKTLRRILAGLKKFHTQPQVMMCNTPGYCQSVTKPVGTVTTVNSKALITPVPFMMQYNGQSIGRHLNDPCATITIESKLYLATPILQSYYSGSNCTSSTNQPAPTVPTKDRFALVTPWIDRNFRSGRSQPITDPAGAVMTVPKMNLCTAFLTPFNFNNAPREIGKPAPTVLATRPIGLCSAFLVPSNFDNTARSINDPAPTILASRKHVSIASAFIVNPQFNNKGNSISDPAPTVIATQKARPLSLATTTTEGTPNWTITSADSTAMIDLKNFMRENSIADIYMRMLKVVELKRIQGFPDGYILKGPLNEQKKFIGNSVETGIVKTWLRAIAQSNAYHIKTATSRHAQAV